MSTKPKSKSKPKSQSKSKKPRDPRQAIIDAAMALAARDGWRRVRMAGIAAECQIDESEVLALFASKAAILDGLSCDIDAALLADIAADGGLDDSDDSPRDRLFDILMRRFDLLEPHKAGLAAVLRDVVCGPPVSSPMDALRHLCRLRGTMAVMLTAAGEATAGPLGALRIKGLGLIYANAVRVWIDDDSPDMSATMAAVDRGLSRAEAVMTRVYGAVGSAPEMRDFAPAK